MTARVTLRFGDEFLDLACERVRIGVTKAAQKEGIPEGYTQIKTAETYDPGGTGQIPSIEAGHQIQVRNEHVSMIQFGERVLALDDEGRLAVLRLEPERYTVEASWQFQCRMLEQLSNIWSEPDEGLWEVRGGRRHFTHSKIMAWVAFDRGVRCIESFKLDGPVDKWRRIRSEIHADVCAHGFDASVGSFVRSYGSSDLDASLLLIPSVGFLPADDGRVRGTIAAVERTLMRDGFVRRYDTATAEDGLPGGEGVFLACSFWLADAYVLMNRLDDAQRLFERLLSLRNDVGLLAEEYDPRTNRQVGNFPQAFSHVALINTAHNLMKATKPAEQRAGVDEGRGHAHR